MFKLRAELQQQGLRPTELELEQEAAMAQNLTLSYGGVIHPWPSTAPCLGSFTTLTPST